VTADHRPPTTDRQLQALPGIDPVVGRPPSVVVEVADTGEGIAPDDLPRIFAHFYRGEKSRSRATGGAGLGLAIARGIVEAHGGRIWAISRPEHGTQIAFTLPLQPPAPLS
jgi:signal transduction histidine kinase